MEVRGRRCEPYHYTQLTADCSPQSQRLSNEESARLMASSSLHCRVELLVVLVVFPLPNRTLTTQSASFYLSCSLARDLPLRSATG